MSIHVFIQDKESQSRSKNTSVSITESGHFNIKIINNYDRELKRLQTNLT